ncbi:MAG: serine hydrolase, partial [Micrococcales bacterium]|nr:serine hydrolase [Micrococcales bacterium]
MGTPPSTSRAGHRAGLRRTRHASGRARSFAATMNALEALASTGGRVSVCVTDLDHGKDLVLGDAFVTLPVAQLGAVPLLIQVSAAMEAGQVDAAASVSRPSMVDGSSAGLWRHFAAVDLKPVDLAVL